MRRAGWGRRSTRSGGVGVRRTNQLAMADGHNRRMYDTRESESGRWDAVQKRGRTGEKRAVVKEGAAVR